MIVVRLIATGLLFLLLTAGARGNVATIVLPLQWIASSFLFLFFAVGSIGNFATIVLRCMRKQSGSTVALIPGVAGVAACLLCPIPEIRSYWWLPLLLDGWTFPFAVWLPFWFARSLVGKSE